MLALGAAPAIVRAESIMRIKPIVLPGEAEFAAIARGNSLITCDQIAREALKILSENLSLSWQLNREWERVRP